MHILCEELHRGGEVGPEHQRGALHGQIFWPPPLFMLTLTLTERSSINILKHGMTFSLPCTIAAPRRSYCRWSSWSCPQHNPLWLQTQTIMMVSMRRNCNIFSSLKVAEVKSYWEIFGKEGIRKRCNLVKLFSLLNKRNNWCRRSTLNIKHKIEQKITQMATSRIVLALNLYLRVRECGENIGEKLIPRLGEN